MKRRGQIESKVLKSPQEEEEEAKEEEVVEQVEEEVGVNGEVASSQMDVFVFYWFASDELEQL